MAGKHKNCLPIEMHSAKLPNSRFSRIFQSNKRLKKYFPGCQLLSRLSDILERALSNILDFALFASNMTVFQERKKIIVCPNYNCVCPEYDCFSSNTTVSHQTQINLPQIKLYWPEIQLLSPKYDCFFLS